MALVSFHNQTGKQESSRMNKKLMAVAVAGVLAAPGLALAQSSVTISGYFKVGVDNYKVSQPSNVAPFHTNATKNSENRVSDSASRIIFGVTEDLGGGLAAIAQMDLRFNPDSATPAGSTLNEIGTGNTFVGLRSKTMGTVVLGRRDTHFGGRYTSGGRITDAAGALQSSACGVFCYAPTGRGGVVAVGVVGRTQNILAYDTPRWGGFGATIAYSPNAPGVEADSTSTSRAGRAWNLNPYYLASNWGIEWSHWDQKNDAPTATSQDQRSDILGGYFTMSGFRVGLAWDKTKLKNALTGVEEINRTVWALPLSYNTGPHTGYFEYTKAKDAGGTLGSAVQDGAKVISIGYNYALSKRTAVAVVYSKLTNDTGAAYQTYSNTGGSGNAASTLGPGEDGRLMALTIKHSF
jgi:predicted porin